MKKTLIALCLLCVTFLSGCGGTPVEQTSLQQTCKHEWSIVGDSFNGFYIYCPKCQLEDDVTEKEWNIMELDKAYRNH